MTDIKRYDEVRVDGSGMEPNEAGDYILHADHIAAMAAFVFHASFLLDRLKDFGEELSEESARDWFGHVEPAMERLKDVVKYEP